MIPVPMHGPQARQTGKRSLIPFVLETAKKEGPDEFPRLALKTEGLTYFV